MPGAESLRAEVEEDEDEGLCSNRVFITVVNSITIVEACIASNFRSGGPVLLKPSPVYRNVSSRDSQYK